MVYAARQARAAFQEMRERLDLARETYGLAREEGQGRVSAGLAALRAAAAKGGREQSPGEIKERLAKIVERDQGLEEPEVDMPTEQRESVRERQFIARSLQTDADRSGEGRA